MAEVSRDQKAVQADADIISRVWLKELDDAVDRADAQSIRVAQSELLKIGIVATPGGDYAS